MSDFDPVAIVSLLSDSIIGARKGDAYEIDWTLAATRLAMAYIAVSKACGANTEAVVKIVEQAARKMTDDAAMAFMMMAGQEAGVEIRKQREAMEMVRRVMKETKETN